MAPRVSKRIKEEADKLRDYLRNNNHVNKVRYLSDLTTIKTIGYRNAIHTLAVRLEALRWINMKTECTEMHYALASPQEKRMLDERDALYEEVRMTLWKYRQELEKKQEEKRTVTANLKDLRKRKQEFKESQGTVKKEKR